MNLMLSECFRIVNRFKDKDEKKRERKMTKLGRDNVPTEFSKAYIVKFAYQQNGTGDIIHVRIRLCFTILYFPFEMVCGAFVRWHGMEMK